MIKYLYKLNTKSNYDALDNEEHIYLPGVSYLTETGEVIFDNWGIKNLCLRQEIQQLSGITELSKRRTRALTNEIFTPTITTEQSQKPFIYDRLYMENGKMYEGKTNEELSFMSYTGNEWAQYNSSIFDENESVITSVFDFVYDMLDQFGHLDSESMAEDNVVLNPNNTTPITNAAKIAEIDTEIYNALNNDAPLGATLEEIYNCDLVKAFNFDTNEINFIGALFYYGNSNFQEDWNISDFKRIKTRYAMDSQENIYIQVSAFGSIYDSSATMHTLQCPDCMEMKKLTSLSNFSDCEYDTNTQPSFGVTLPLLTVANPFANSQTMEKLAIPEQINYMATGTLENTPALEEVHLLGINNYGNMAFGWSGHDSLTQVHFYQPTEAAPTLEGSYVFGDATTWADNAINWQTIGNLMSGEDTTTPITPVNPGGGQIAKVNAIGGVKSETNNSNTLVDTTSQPTEEEILSSIGGIKFIFHCKLKTFGEIDDSITESLYNVPMDYIIEQFLCSTISPYSFNTVSGVDDPFLLENILFILQDSDAKKLIAALRDQDSELYCPELVQRILPYSILKNQASNFDNGDTIEPLTPDPGLIIADN